MIKRKLSDFNNIIFKLYQEGLSDEKIANIVNFSKKSIFEWRKKRNLISNFSTNKRLTTEMKHKMLHYYHSGKSDSQIAKILKISINTVFTWRKKKRLPAQKTLSQCLK